MTEKKGSPGYGFRTYVLFQFAYSSWLMNMSMSLSICCVVYHHVMTIVTINRVHHPINPQRDHLPKFPSSSIYFHPNTVPLCSSKTFFSVLFIIWFGFTIVSNNVFILLLWFRLASSRRSHRMRNRQTNQTKPNRKKKRCECHKK